MYCGHLTGSRTIVSWTILQDVTWGRAGGKKSNERRGCQVGTDPGNRGAWSCDPPDTVIQSGAVNSAHLNRKSKWGQIYGSLPLKKHNTIYK